MDEQKNLSPNQISVELSARRTEMSFQPTRMSADCTLMSVIRTSLSLISFGFTIFQFFKKLQESNLLQGSAAPARHFGIWLVVLGILMLITGIIYHIQFMVGLRKERLKMKEEGLIHAESLLLIIGIIAIINMVFHIGPFG